MTTPLGSARGTVTIYAGQALRELAKLRAANAATIGSLNQTGRSAIVAGAGVAAAGGVIAAGFIKAVSIASQLQFKMAFLQATLNATDDEMRQLNASVLEFGQTSGFGPREVADAFVELGKAGVSAHEIISGVGRAVITLGQSADIGLSQAAEIIVSTQATFQKLGYEAQRTADIIQGAANASLIDVADFGVTMKYVGNVASTQGIQLEDLATAIAEIGNQGIRGSTAGTSLRRMLLQLTPRTDEAAQAMKDLGIITKNGTNLFYDETGSAKSLRDIFEILHRTTEGLTDAKKKDALATIFGDRAIATALATAKGGAKLYDEFNKQLNESTAAEIAAKRFDTLEGAVRKFKGAFETAFVVQGSAAQKPLQRLVENATALVQIFNKLDPATQRNISRTALLVAGILLLTGSMTILFGTVLRAIALYKQLRLAIVATSTAMGASAAASALLASGLTGGLLIGIGVLVANLYGMASGAAEASRKIQELTGNLNFGDTGDLYRARAEILKLVEAEYDAQEATGLFGEFVGTLNGSLARSRAKIHAYTEEYDFLNKKLGDSYYNIKRLSDVTGLSEKELRGLARAAHVDMSGDIKEAGRQILEYRRDAVAGRVTTGNLSRAFDVMADSADEATGEVDDLETALRKVADMNIDAADAEIAFREAVREAKEALGESGRVFDKNGKLLQANSEEGQAAEKALLNIARAGREHYDALVAQGAGEKTLAAAQQATRDELIKVAVQMGMSKAAATRYADQLGIIPPVKETKIQTPGMKTAQTEVDKYIAMLEKIPEEWTTFLNVLITPHLQGDPGVAPSGGDLILDPLRPPRKPDTKVNPNNVPLPTQPTSPAKTPVSTPKTIPTPTEALFPGGVKDTMPHPQRNAAPAPISAKAVRAPTVIPTSSTTVYELNGPVVASDPVALQRDLENKKRLAALRGG